MSTERREEERMAETGVVEWRRSDEGFADSKDGRWTISPLYMGTTRPQGYQLWDHKTKRRAGTGDTQRELKELASDIARTEAPHA